jgi:hypothetical protein
MWRKIIVMGAAFGILGGCQTKSAVGQHPVQVAAGKCTDQITKANSGATKGVAELTIGRTHIYPPTGPLGVGVYQESETMGVDYAALKNEARPGTTWRACMLSAGVDTKNATIKF